MVNEPITFIWPRMLGNYIVQFTVVVASSNLKLAMISLISIDSNKKKKS